MGSAGYRLTTTLHYSLYTCTSTIQTHSMQVPENRANKGKNNSRQKICPYTTIVQVPYYQYLTLVQSGIYNKGPVQITYQTVRSDHTGHAYNAQCGVIEAARRIGRTKIDVSDPACCPSWPTHYSPYLSNK